MKVPALPRNLVGAAEDSCIMWSIKEDLRIYVSPAHVGDVLGTGTLCAASVDQSIFMMIETCLERVERHYSWMGHYRRSTKKRTVKEKNVFSLSTCRGVRIQGPSLCDSVIIYSGTLAQSNL